jgi:acyl-CoA synthetase (AMP-forming)/AMP-acid ligase II
MAPGRPRADQHHSGDWASGGALSRLLAEAARLHPDRPAFRDGPGRESWCGRPSFELSCEIADEAVARLAGYLAELELEFGSRVGICLPNGSEAAMSILAVGAAGLTPCLLDATATAGELSNAIESADIRAVITQARLGADRLAEKLCFVAAGFFRLRFLLAFGPNVPDGVVDLDPVLLERRRSRPVSDRSADPSGTEPGFVSFARGSAGRSPYFRSYRSLIAAAAPIVRAAKLRPGDRLLTVIPPDDLKGLATGLVAALVASATLEAHAVFDSASFAHALTGPEPTHLVVPGWMEPALVQMNPRPLLRSTLLVHEPPLHFEDRPAGNSRIVDVVCCSELALLSAPRVEPGRISYSALCDAGEGEGGPSLLEVNLSTADEIRVRGPAVALADRAGGDPLEWYASGLIIERNGTAIAGIA